MLKHNSAHRSYLAMFLLTAVTCTCLGSYAADNGAIVRLTIGIPAYNGQDGYLLNLYYAVFDDISSPPDGGAWEVRTEAGTKAAYWECFGVHYLFGDLDFSEHEKAALSADFEQRHNLSHENDYVAPPSARYNCYAYAVGKTGYWIRGPGILRFIYDDGWAEIDAEDAVCNSEVSTHGLLSPIQYPDHVSKTSTERVYVFGTWVYVLSYSGKMSHCGVYKTLNLNIVENICNQLGETRYWKM